MVTKAKPKKTMRKRLLLCGALLLLLLYVGSYCVLSALGGYSPAKTGNYRLNVGTAFFDIQLWFPRYGYAQLYTKIDGTRTVHADNIGLFYCPLIILDQQYIHKSKPLE